MQILGPPLKGRYSHPGLSFSHLSGLNSSASSPYRSFRRCMVYSDHCTDWPFGMKRGDLPSSPPPRGRMVSTTAQRVLPGTTGYNLNAKLSCQPTLPRKGPVKGGVTRFLTFIQNPSQIFHILYLLECRLLSSQRIHLLSQLCPDVRSSG